MAVSMALLTRFTMGLPSTRWSRSATTSSAADSFSTTSTSLSASEARNESMSELPAEALWTNSRRFSEEARTGRIRHPVRICSRSILGRDWGSAMATVSVPCTLNRGTASRRRASSSPIRSNRAKSMSPCRS